MVRNVYLTMPPLPLTLAKHVGVIGPNGAGKSTLFKILINEEDLDDGKVIRSQSLRLGYLSQHDTWTPTETGNTYLERVCRLPVGRPRPPVATCKFQMTYLLNPS